MTNLTANPGWDSVPEIETNTSLLGGPGGPLNQQAQALLDRTEVLNPDNQTAPSSLDGTETWSFKKAGSWAQAKLSSVAQFVIQTFNGFLQSGSGAVARPVQSKLLDAISVKDFGAKGDGVTNDSAAFQAAYNACPAYGCILVPDGSYPPPTVTGTKYVVWRCEGQPTTGPLFNLPGLVEQAIANRKVAVKKQTTSSDYAGNEFRRETSHTGGTAGNVNSAVVVYTNVAAGITDYEWGFLSQLDNYATAGENVAIYGQANKKAGNVGPTWAAVFEARNANDTDETGGGLTGIEVDVFANGANPSNNRIGVDVSLGKGDSAGAACSVYAGMRVGPTFGDVTQASILNGLLVNGVVTNGVQVNGTATYGYLLAGTASYGLDTSTCTISGSAIRLARGQTIALEPTNTFTVAADTSNPVIKIMNGGAEKVGFEIDSTPALRINGTAVVGARSTGWTAMTGTSDQSTAFATSTVTLTQLAERVMALQAALTAHGLIGT